VEKSRKKFPYHGKIEAVDSTGPPGAIVFVLLLALFTPLYSWAIILSEDFSTLTDNAPPSGWTAKNSSNLDYTGEPYVGAAPSAFKFSGTGQWLMSPIFDTGSTNLHFWAYGNGGSGSIITVSGLVSGVWTLLDSVTITQNDGTYDVVLDSQTTQLKFSFTKTKNCSLDDIMIQGTVVVEDPNLAAVTSMSFDPLIPGTAATQTLVLANSGASNTLHLTSLSPISGDTGKFSVASIPATLAPGASTNIPVIYTPGMNTGVYHSAVYHLITDDPSTPTHVLTISGETIGASLTVSNIQYSGSGSTSPENGNQVRVTGIATYADPWGYALSDPDGGPWSGIYVSDVNHRPEIGDQVLLEGWVSESDSMTILSSVSDYQTLGSGFSVPASTITGSQLATEAYEGVYVRMDNVTVNNINVGSAEEFWQVTDGSSVRIGTRVPYRYIWHLNDTLDAVQGILFVEGSTRSIQPRNDWDLIGRRGLVMTPDGPRTNWYVQVEDDRIMAVTNVAPAGITILDTGGILFPGLIDAHNHPSWNSFPTLMFNDFPFGHRDEWAATSEYSAWKSKRNTVRNHSSVQDTSHQTISKYAEALELMAGCIAIQGNYSDPEYAHPDVMLFNVEQFPGRVWADIFPWKSTSSERAELSEEIEGGAVNAAIIHLCEGVDETARAQFDTWRNWGMLNEATTIIHGAALGASEFTQMATAGAKLVWSPMSNMKLYGGTADVKAAKEAGVVIGLSPDWTASGCYNILEELGYAWELNQSMFENAFTAREMAEMVYLNTALCAGLGNHYGKIETGYNAGLVVIDGDTSDPYMALIHARPADVLLTIVDGTPRYGDPGMMSTLGASGESVTISGVSKRFNIAVNHPFLDYGSTTFAQLRSALQTAHNTLTTTSVLNEDELQFLDLSLLQGSGGDNIEPFRADQFIRSAPGTAIYDVGSSLSVRFRYEDFWDNDTYITNLTQTISIAPALYPQFLLQTIATNRANTPANETVPFTIAFQDMHTNYVFVFETRDAKGNVRTTIPTNTFRLAYHTGGDTDSDGMPNEWEIQYFGGFSNGVPTGNQDGDALDNLSEYVADTIPTSAGSCLEASIDALEASAAGTMQMQSPVPTSAQRIYDVWWSSNLLGEVVWHPAGLDVPGNAGGASVTLRVTNTLPRAVYRTGVKLP